MAFINPICRSVFRRVHSNISSSSLNSYSIRQYECHVKSKLIPTTQSKEISISHQTRFCTMAATSSSASSDKKLIDDVLTYWFGKCENFHRYELFEDQKRKWYGGGTQVDEEIREKFGSHVESALNGSYDHLIDSNDHGLSGDLAMVIMLDQFTRNIFRRSGRAFEGDKKCRGIVINLLDGGSAPQEQHRWDLIAKKELPCTVRMCFLLPLMHQENLADQDRCYEEIEKMINELDSEGDAATECATFIRQSLTFSAKHRDVIVQYGRFPYRNEALGRESTSEEIEYLRDGDRYGQ